MDTLRHDLRYALRSLLASRAFTSVAVLTLALGIGANTTIFTVVNAVLLNPLPVAEPGRLVDVYTTDSQNTIGSFSQLPVSYRNYEDFRDQNQGFSGLAAYTSFLRLALDTGETPIEVPGTLATANYFDVLGVDAHLGRTFLPDENRPGGAPVSVLSHSLWSRSFGEDASILGRTLRINDAPYTVVGVMPRGFKGTATLGDPDQIWIPMAMHDQILTGPARAFFLERRALLLSVVGRLRPAVTLGQARTDMEQIAARLAADHPRANEARGVSLVPTAEAAVGINQREQYVRAGSLVMGVVALVLLLACVNLANLLLARATTREKELSVRVALGAHRRRLLRQLMVESLLLAAMGGAAGLVVAFWARSLLWALRPPFLPDQAVALHFDVPVLLFTVGLTLATGLLFGLAPAVRASDPDVSSTLKLGGRRSGGGWGRGGLRSLLIVTQVALALVALIGAGLFVRSMQHAQRIDPGFETDRLVVLSLSPGRLQYAEERGQQLYESLVERVSGIPGVTSAAIASNRPLGGGFLRSVIPEGQVPGPGEPRILVTTNAIDPEYFRTLAMPLLRGRGTTRFDREHTTAVAVVNEAMAARFWPGEDPVGKRFSFIGEDTLREVVGVVRNSTVVQLGEDPQMVAYLPVRQVYAPAAALHVRTAGEPGALLETIRREAQQLAPAIPITDVTTVGEILDQGLWAPRMGAALLGAFGLLALVLAAVGVYGVMAYAVSQRTHEMGLRMALGAQMRDVLSLVVREGMRLALAGVACGLIAAALLAHLVESLLFGVSPRDPAIFAGIAVMLSLVAALACTIPAHRATRVDPVIALRAD